MSWTLPEHLFWPLLILFWEAFSTQHHQLSATVKTLSSSNYLSHILYFNLLIHICLFLCFLSFLILKMLLGYLFYVCAKPRWNLPIIAHHYKSQTFFFNDDDSLIRAIYCVKFSLVSVGCCVRATLAHNCSQQLSGEG